MHARYEVRILANKTYASTYNVDDCLSQFLACFSLLSGLINIESLCSDVMGGNCSTRHNFMSLP